MTVLEASVESRATADELARVVLSPEQLPKWFPTAKRVEADKEWPKVGGKMRWGGKGDKWAFEAVIATKKLPHELMMNVRTPSGRSQIIHRFEALPGGKTRYVKQVLPEYEGFNQKIAWLLDRVITRAMNREVERVAALAEGRTP